MKKHKFYRITAVLLCLCAVLSMLSATALAAYENTYKNTGNGAADIAGVAKTQIGNTSGSKYNTTGAWCCAFVVWCARQAGIGASVIPETFSCTMMYNTMNAKKLVSSKSSYTPKTGDLVFFSSTSSLSNIDHIGIVTGVSGKTFYVVEGNYNAHDGKGYRVASTSYTAADSKVLAFATPNYSGDIKAAGLNFLVNETTRVRSGASTSYSILGQMSAGSYITVSQITPDNWGQISYNDETAWICLDWSSFVSGTFSGEYVLNMRAAASIAGSIIGTVPKNTLLKISKIDSADRNWGYTTFEGKSGWVCLSSGADREAEVDWLMVDISQWNDPAKINWAKLSADGVKAVIIRVGGRYVSTKALYTDDVFMKHYTNAKAAGLHVGAYFFSYALNEAQAREEARMTIDILQKNKCELDMPVFIDIEEYSESDGTDFQHYDAGKNACTAVVNAFCNSIEAAGYYPGIYCSKSFAEDLIDASAFNNRAVWIAHYGVTQCGYNGNYDMWQYTRCGRLTGFSGDIDLSRCYTDFPALIAGLKEENFGDHKAGEWETVSAATCSADGKRQKKCVDCGIPLKTEVIPAAGHTPGQMNIYLLNTSLKPGMTLTSEIIKKFHTPDEADFELLYFSTWQTQGGTKLSYCTKCKEVLTAEYSYPECEHKSCTDKTIRAATCAAEGLKETVCNTCSKTVYSQYIPLTAHKEGSQKYSRTSCAESGTRETLCAVCGETVSSVFVTPTQHTVTAWTTEQKLTCAQDGIYTTVCAVCKQKLTRLISHPLFGDIDADNSVSASDARLALRAAVSLETLSEAAAAAADVDANGKIEAADARLLLRMSVNLENADELFKKYCERQG